MIARATDLGELPKSSTIDVAIRVVASDKRPPTFFPRSTLPIKLMENFTDFDAKIISLRVVPNVNSSKLSNSYVIFQLFRGGTDQTNRGDIFRYLSIRLYCFFFIPCKSEA